LAGFDTTTMTTRKVKINNKCDIPENMQRVFWFELHLQTFQGAFESPLSKGISKTLHGREVFLE